MNVYKDFIVLHNIQLDPREVKLFVDWLLSCEKDSQAYKIGEAMQAANDNYAAESLTMSKTAKCANLNFEGECRVTNTLCDNCMTLGRLLREE